MHHCHAFDCGVSWQVTNFMEQSVRLIKYNKLHLVYWSKCSWNFSSDHVNTLTISKRLSGGKNVL